MEAVSLAAVESGEVTGDVLVNTTSVGMTPDVQDTPVPRSALGGYRLVFDAVYTPLETRLLKVRITAWFFMPFARLWKMASSGRV